MVRPVLAATQPLSNLYQPGANLGGSTATLSTLINPLITNALIFIGLTAFIVFIFSGFNYITSNGDKAKVEQATNTLQYAIMGIVLAAVAYVITQLVGRVGGFDFTNPGI